MIVFDVTCKNDHTFEGWFKDSDTFDRLASKGEIACPICNDTNVRKGLVAPRLGGMRKGKDSISAPEPAEAMQATDNGKTEGDKKKADAEEFKEFLSTVRELKRHVEENSTYVGDRFPEEARKIHYGETEPQSIYGEATPKEAAELNDEGIEFHRIPWPAKPDA